MTAPPLPVTVAILAGGQSRRMGTDKALIELDGQPLIARVVERMQPLNPEDMMVIGREPAQYAFLRLPVVTDITPDLGPMGGLLTALTRARNPNVIIVGCDMPFASADVMAALLHIQREANPTHDAVVPLWAGRPQPLHALYHRQCLAVVEQALMAGERSMLRLLRSLNTRMFSKADTARYDPDGRAFTNLNTPDDVQAAQTNLPDRRKLGEANLAPPQ